MKLEIDIMPAVSNKKFNLDIDENTMTLRGLLQEVKMGGALRFLKIPQTSDDTLQTINISPDNLDLPIVKLGFQNNARYTIV